MVHCNHQKDAEAVCNPILAIYHPIFDEQMKAQRERQKRRRGCDPRPTFKVGEEIEVRGGRFEVSLVVESGIFLEWN